MPAVALRIATLVAPAFVGCLGDWPAGEAHVVEVSGWLGLDQNVNFGLYLGTEKRKETNPQDNLRSQDRAQCGDQPARKAPREQSGLGHIGQ